MPLGSTTPEHALQRHRAADGDAGPFTVGGRLFELPSHGSWQQSSQRRGVNQVIAMARSSHFLTAALICAAASVTGLNAQELIQSEASAPSQPVGHFDLGTVWVSDSAYKFGEYSGLADKGLHVIADLAIRYLPTAAESANYWNVNAGSLSNSAQWARVEYGRHGGYSLFADYRAIPHFRFADARTPFAGKDLLTLPPAWVAATTTAGFAALEANLMPVRIKTERSRYGLGFTFKLADQWEMTGQYRLDRKEGIDATAGIFGSNGGNPLAAQLPRPIDAATHEANLSIAYSARSIQAEASYRLSHFDNTAGALTWQNPYAFRAGYHPSQSYSAGGLGRLALEPDNTAQTFSASVAFLLSPTARLISNFSYGHVTQNDAFLPYTINPNLVVTRPLPRTSLNGRLQTIHAGASFTTKLYDNLDAKLRYKFDDRSNNTPQDTFVVIPSDTLNQDTLASARARINRPYSRLSHKAEAEAIYRMSPRTRVLAGYDFDLNEREFTEVRMTTEHAGKLELRSAFAENVTGWARYSYSRRTGSQYVSNEALLTGHSQNYLDMLAPEERFENDPLLRRYDIADRSRHLGKARADITISEAAVGLSGTLSHSEFDATVIGLTSSRYASGTLDISLQPIGPITASGFVTWERTWNAQNGYSRPSGPFPPGATYDPRRRWSIAARDAGYTAGVDLDWAAIKDKLSMAFNYTMSRTNSDFNVGGGSLLTFADLSDVKSTVHSGSIQGDYRFSDYVRIRFYYLLEQYRSSDFALDGVLPSTIPTVLTLGIQSPRYTMHAVGVSVRRSF